jgi:hypothetical protein
MFVHRIARERYLQASAAKMPLPALLASHALGYVF